MRRLFVFLAVLLLGGVALADNGPVTYSSGTITAGSTTCFPTRTPALQIIVDSTGSSFRCDSGTSKFVYADLPACSANPPSAVVCTASTTTRACKRTDAAEVWGCSGSSGFMVNMSGSGAAPSGSTNDVQVKSGGGLSNAPGLTADISTGAVTVKSLNAVRKADQFSGADACAKIAAAISDLPSTGGVVDARGIIGAQTCATNPFASETKIVQVLLGVTTITTTAQWALPNRTTVAGIGRDATVLKADPTFPTSTAVVRLGQGLAAIGITGTRIENMQIDCNAVAGSIGVYSTEINELSGGNHLLIQKFMSAGIKIEGSGSQVPANYIFDDSEIYSDTSATAADGVYIGAGSGRSGVFRRLTVVNLGGGHVQPRGIYVATGAYFSNVNVEFSTDAFYLDTNATNVQIANANCSNTSTTLIRIIGSGAMTLSNLIKGTATNIVRNDYLGTTITDAFLPSYNTTTTTNGYQAYSNAGRTISASSGANVEALVAPNWSIKSKENPPATGNSVSALSFLDYNNDGFTWRASSPTAAPPGFMSLQLYVAGSITTTPVQFTSLGNATFLGTIASVGLTPSGRFSPPHSTTLPATCTVGDEYFDTDATAGQNKYGCTSTNVWTIEGDGGGNFLVNAGSVASPNLQNDSNVTFSNSGANIHATVAPLAIVNAQISASAAIVDTKLATISTPGKVANAATTATDAATASTIVARDANKDFTARDITARSFIQDGSTADGSRVDQFSENTIALNDSLPAGTDELGAEAVSVGHGRPIWRNLDGRTPMFGIGAVATATVNAVAATDVNVAELALPPGYLNRSNAVSMFNASGNWVSGTTSTPTMTFKIKLCTVSGCGSGTVLTLVTVTSAAATASTTQQYRLDGTVGTTATGATGTVLAHVVADLPVGSTNNTAFAGFHDVNTAVSSAIDLTAALYLELVWNASTMAGTTHTAAANSFSVVARN